MFLIFLPISGTELLKPLKFPEGETRKASFVMLMSDLWKGPKGSLIPEWEDPPDEDMVTHSSILAWRIQWTEEPARLQSMEPDMTEHVAFRSIGMEAGCPGEPTRRVKG